jgi:hypothetical protein
MFLNLTGGKYFPQPARTRKWHCFKKHFLSTEAHVRKALGWAFSELHLVWPFSSTVDIWRMTFLLENRRNLNPGRNTHATVYQYQGELGIASPLWTAHYYGQPNPVPQVSIILELATLILAGLNWTGVDHLIGASMALLSARVKHWLGKHHIYGSSTAF